MHPADFTAIVAIDQARGIGKNNQLLWHMPADLRHFKALTLNQTILMGRKTYDAIGKALPQRNNIVLTRDLGFRAADVTVIHDLNAAIKLAQRLSGPLIIIGGAEIYQLFLPYLNRIELTLVKHRFDADTFFPDLAANEWQAISQTEYPADEKNPYPYEFISLQKIKC